MKRNEKTAKSVLSWLISTLRGVTSGHPDRQLLITCRCEAIGDLYWIGYTWEEAKTLVDNELKTNGFNI